MKIRLYRGPADGKVFHIDYPGNSVAITVPKKMSHKQRWEFVTNQPLYSHEPYPMIKSYYVRTNFRHPDGSVFYEWEQPRRRRVT